MKKIYIYISLFLSLLLNISCNDDSQDMAILKKTEVYEISPEKGKPHHKLSVYKEINELIFWENNEVTKGDYEIKSYEDLSTDSTYNFSYNISYNKDFHKDSVLVDETHIIKASTELFAVDSCLFNVVSGVDTIAYKAVIKKVIKEINL